MSNFPAKEPRLDRWVSEVTGEQVEELSGISATQPYTSDGPWLSSTGLELLTQLAERHRLGRFDLQGNPTAVRDLVEADVITEKGKLTDEGEFLLSPLRATRAVVSLSAQYGRHSSGLRIHMGDSGALITAGRSHHSLLEQDAGTSNQDSSRVDEGSAQLEMVENEAVPEMIGRWIGLGPAWSIEMVPEQLPVATLESRFVDDMTAAPAEADDRFLRMWHEPWVVFTLSMEPGDFRAGLVNAGAAGFYSYGGIDADRAALQATPSGALWDMLVTETERTLLQ
ncbi:hypothetical protein [Arthrobacter castelli]|uniref:hypothetical protein n=1 Tax=Arthrobacter castelli TaxID=271431 RepID=UPI0003F4B57C|nr:hypothetical protein [Arthrobacter castelli]